MGGLGWWDGDVHFRRSVTSFCASYKLLRIVVKPLYCREGDFIEQWPYLQKAHLGPNKVVFIKGWPIRGFTVSLGCEMGFRCA